MSFMWVSVRYQNVPSRNFRWAHEGVNYLKARQRAVDKRFDYTQMNDKIVWPIGYCAGYREYTLEERNAFCMSDKWYEEYESRKSQYHADGHVDAEEACECYKRYLLDSSLHYGVDTKKKCEVCKEWTDKRTMIGGYTSFVLCETHTTRAVIASLFTVGESWES